MNLKSICLESLESVKLHTNSTRNIWCCHFCWNVENWQPQIWLHLPLYTGLGALLCNVIHIWRALWKNWISSTTMKLRKSLVKPVTWQNISSCLVLPPEIVMHNAFNVILWTSADICVIVHDDLGWKNQTTHCNRFWRAGCGRLEYIDIRLVY